MRDRGSIFDSIEPDNPRAAVRMDDKILEHANLLMRFPYMGRKGRVRGTRELVISQSPYIAAYRVSESEVRILRVIHAKQHWPNIL